MRGWISRLPIGHFASTLLNVFLTFSLPILALGEERPTVDLEPIVVTAEKRSQALQYIPQSVSILNTRTISESGVTAVKEASYLVPNLYISEFSARRTSFPTIRGLGSGQGEPVVATYIDGVPQLTPNTTNIELLDIDRIEVIRGPQGALYGRNSLGGVIHIITQQSPPSEMMFGSIGFGEFSLQRYRLSISAPLVPDAAYFSIAGAYSERDGYVRNVDTGNSIDDREALFGRATLRLTSQDNWDISLGVYGERDRDGDFVLFDLESIRDDAFRIRHDFEGRTDRDIISPSLSISHYGVATDFVSITSYNYWRATDLTDLDFSAVDFLRRKTDEKQHQIYQELRLQSAEDAGLELTESLSLQWLAGISLFYSEFENRSYDEIRPGAALIPPFLPPELLPIRSFSEFELRDLGLGLVGQTNITFVNKLDLNLAMRFDYEHRNADVKAISNSIFTEFDQDFTELLPKIGLTYRWNNYIMSYLHAAKGFRAGGYNRNINLGGSFKVDEEESWTYEAGLKTSWFENRLRLNTSFFYIDWDNMQLDVPNPETPGRFFLDNVGESESKGFEVELQIRSQNYWELFGGFGYTEAEFEDYIDPITGLSVDGNNLPNVPEFTWNIGLHKRFVFRSEFNLFTAAELLGVGKLFFDNTNKESQNDYILANFRVGIGYERWSLVAWIRNAFDDEYVSLAFPVSRTNFVGRNGAPQTVGVTLKFEM